MEAQFICTLHSDHYCIHRSHGYGCSHECGLKISEGYVVSYCLHRLKATELPAAAKPEEPPVNIEQQGQPEITATAESMQSEIEKIF